MRKNKKSCSISKFCRNDNFRTFEFYKMLGRHPELAKKLKTNSKGEHALDEKGIPHKALEINQEKWYNKSMNKQLTFSLISDELAQAKKNFLKRLSV